MPQRRWNADRDGDFKLLDVCSAAEERLLEGFFDNWIANMRLKNLAYSHFRKVLVESDRGPTWYSASKDLA